MGGLFVAPPPEAQERTQEMAGIDGKMKPVLNIQGRYCQKTGVTGKCSPNAVVTTLEILNGLQWIQSVHFIPLAYMLIWAVPFENVREGRNQTYFSAQYTANYFEPCPSTAIFCCSGGLHIMNSNACESNAIISSSIEKMQGIVIGEVVNSQFVVSK